MDGRTRLQAGLIFGVFEAGMPVLGLPPGHGLAGALGQAARWAGGALLIAAGGYTLIRQRRDPARPAVTGLALSIDNIAAGFALGTCTCPAPSPLASSAP